MVVLESWRWGGGEAIVDGIGSNVLWPTRRQKAILQRRVGIK